MRVEIHLAPNDPSLHALRSAWLASADRFAGDTAALADEARAMHDTLATRDIPPALREALALVPRVADLLTDPDWTLAADQRRDFVGALAYFIDNDDLIPDNTGRYGYLDDAMVVRLALQSSAQEWHDWNDYRQFRSTHPEITDLRRHDWQRGREALIERMVKQSMRSRFDGDEGYERRYSARSDGGTRFSIR